MPVAAPVAAPVETINKVEPLSFAPPPPAIPNVPTEPPESYVESPLTRARRIDAQNTWREQQIKAYFFNKAAPVHNKDPFKMDEEKPKAEETRFKLPEAQLPVAFATPEKPSLLEDEQPPADLDNLDSIVAESPIPVEPMAKNEPLDVEPVAAFDTLNRMDDWINQAEQLEQQAEQLEQQKDASKMISPGEEIRRQRLKERQEKAIERRKELIKKAMDQKTGRLSGTSIISTTSTISRIPQRSAGPSFKPPIQATVTQVPPKPVQSQVSSKPAPQVVNKPALQNQVSNKAVQVPVKRTLPALPSKPHISRPAPLPIRTQQATIAPSPAPTVKTLPKISTSEDEENAAPLTVHKPTGNRPDWAKTPALAVALAQQQKQVRPEDIFGEVQPVKLEDFFKDTGKRYARSRTSNINWRP